MADEQTVKDTFYQALRDRVAAGNPARTVVVRGVVRPAVLVVENELPGASLDGISPVNAFCLRWTGLAVKQRLVTARCELRYATDGTAGAAGMDRGRALAAMDGELVRALSGGAEAGAMVTEALAGMAAETSTGTNVFWGDVRFGAVVMRGERLERTAEIEVFGYV